MRKNVLIFGHGYGTPFVDVSNQYTQLFDETKYDLTVVYLVGEPDPVIKQQHIAKNIIFLNSPKKSVRGLKIHAIKKMLRLHQEKQFEIVICHRYKPFYIMLWVSFFKKIPALLGVMHELNTLKNISRRLLIALLAGKNNILFAGVSDSVRNNMRRDIWRINKERVVTLYNMIDVEKTERELSNKQDARTQLQLPQDAFLFGNIGRLVTNKDQKTLIQAFANVKTTCTNAKLVVMGAGQLDAALKQQAHELGLAQDIIFTGFVAEGYRFLKAFDLFVLSSTQEAFGRVLLEAMVAKIPVIATRVNGIPEVIGNTGLLIDPANPDELAAAMLHAEQLLKTSRENWVNQAYERIVDEFSTNRFNEVFWQLPLIQHVRAASDRSSR